MSIICSLEAGGRGHKLQRYVVVLQHGVALGLIEAKPSSHSHAEKAPTASSTEEKPSKHSSSSCFMLGIKALCTPASCVTNPSQKQKTSEFQVTVVDSVQMGMATCIQHRACSHSVASCSGLYSCSFRVVLGLGIICCSFSDTKHDGVLDRMPRTHYQQIRCVFSEIFGAGCNSGCRLRYVTILR